MPDALDAGPRRYHLLALGAALLASSYTPLGDALVPMNLRPLVGTVLVALGLGVVATAPAPRPDL